MPRVIAERYAIHANECLNCSSGRRHEQQSERDLSRNQRRVQTSAFYATCQPPRAGLHHLADLRPGRLQSGKQAEDDSAQQRQAYAEEQDREVDVEVSFVWIGVVRQAWDDESYRA